MHLQLQPAAVETKPFLAHAARLPHHGGMGLKVFLSYAHDANTALVLSIRRDLETAGHTPWIDTAEIKTGDDWRRTILDGLADTNVTLAFLSRHAVREGGVCLDEIALALGMRHGNLATILVEPEPEVQPPVSVSHLQWLDMSGWATQDDAWYQDRLRTILDLLDDPETQRFRGEIEDLESRLHPITQAADIPPLIDGFVGREWVVAAVEAWRTSQPQRRIFRLTGGPGAGKSAFSAWLAHYQRANVVGLNLCKWNDEDRSDPRRVLRTLAFLLATRLPDYRRRLLDRFRRHDPKGEELDRKGAAAMFHWLLAEPLQQLIDGGRRRDRCVLLIDALDETLRNDTSELADLLAELAPKLPAWLALLLTSRPEFPIAASLSHIPPFRLDAECSTENADDLRDYARQWLATPARTQAAADALIARVVGAAAGNFMYLRKLREAVEEFALDLERPGTVAAGAERPLPLVVPPPIPCGSRLPVGIRADPGGAGRRQPAGAGGTAADDVRLGRADRGAPAASPRQPVRGAAGRRDAVPRLAARLADRPAAVRRRVRVGRGTRKHTRDSFHVGPVPCHGGGIAARCVHHRGAAGTTRAPGCGCAGDAARRAW